MTGLNTHTGDHTKAVETGVSVQIGAETHRFSVWCSRESAAVLQREDWLEAGRRLREHIQTTRTRMALSGALFLPGADATLREEAERVMPGFIYDRLRARQQQAGCELWQVDSLLAGERYRV